MKIQKSSSFLCLVAAFLCVGIYAQVGVLPKKDVTLKQATDEKFRVGDVWEYQTRKGEERSRITILRIDDSPEIGTIIHVGVDNVHFRKLPGRPRAGSRPTHAICAESNRRKR